MLCPYILAMALALSAADDRLADKDFCDSVHAVWFPTVQGGHACFVPKQKCRSDVKTSQQWRDGVYQSSHTTLPGAIYTHVENDTSGEQITGLCKWSIDFWLNLKMWTREKFCIDVNGSFKDLGDRYVCITSKSTCAPNVLAGSETYNGAFVPGKDSSEEGDQVTQVQDDDGRTIGICIWKNASNIGAVIGAVIVVVILLIICCCTLGICWCYCRKRKGATSDSKAPVEAPRFEVKCEA